MMNTYSKSILGAIFAAALLIGVAHAQTSSVTTGSELESTGIISEYTPGTELVLDIGTGDPVQFKLSQNVVYEDPDGTVLEAPALSTNLRIRVYYLKVARSHPFSLGRRTTVDHLVLVFLPHWQCCGQAL